MNQHYLRDQRGVAMLLELVLVAAVLALVGLAVYQSNHHAGTASVQSKPAVASSTEGLAASAAAIGTADSASDTATSASADAMADEATSAENDVSNLGSSANDSF